MFVTPSNLISLLIPGKSIIVGVVAVRTLPLEMVRWSGVAGLAVGEAAMVKRRLCPVVCVVATGALPLEMVRRSGVAGLAVGEAAVVK